VFALAGVVLFIVLAAALVARNAIEATLLQRAFATAIGGDATIAALRYDGGARILDNLHLRTGDGSLDVTAEHVMLADRGDTLDVTAAGVRVTVAANRVQGDELGRLGALGGALGSDRVLLHVHDAVADIARTTESGPLVRLAGIVLVDVEVALTRRHAASSTLLVVLAVLANAGAVAWLLGRSRRR